MTVPGAHPNHGGPDSPADQPMRFADDSWFRYPATRRSFSQVRQLMPTAVVRRSRGPAYPLPPALRGDLDGVSFLPLDRPDPMTWAESLTVNRTDAIVVLHRGRIVFERYFGAMAPERQHLAFSVTKSFVATLAAMLIVEGAFDESRSVASYLPALAASGIGDATIRQLLDMTTGIDATEDYTDPGATVWDLCRAAGFLARPPGYRGPDSLFEYLTTLRKAVPHGERFAYRTVNTDTVAAILRLVTGSSLSDLLHDRIVARLGFEEDAYFTVDPTGAEFAGAGLNLTVRDLARFGELMRLGGLVDGRQVIPEAAIADIRRGGDRARFALAGYHTLPGWSYRSMWWVSHDDHGVFMARGIHGQALYVDPLAEVVIARFASHPMAANVNLDPTSLPAYRAVATHLMTTG